MELLLAKNKGEVNIAKGPREVILPKGVICSRTEYNVVFSTIHHGILLEYLTKIHSMDIMVVLKKKIF